MVKALVLMLFRNCSTGTGVICIVDDTVLLEC